MHRALYIGDIQDLILGDLGNADLARLARVCKDLEIPALRRLWRFVNSKKLQILAHLGHQHCHLPYFGEPARECPRLKLYSNLVRSAYLTFDMEPQWNQMLYGLFERKMDQVVFPNLGKLTVAIHDSPHLCARANSFVSASLFRLEITCGDPARSQPGWDGHLKDLLDHVQQKCSGLEYLDVTGIAVPASNMLDRALASVVDSSTQLLQFHGTTTVVGPNAMATLSRHRKLRSLVLQSNLDDHRSLQLDKVDQQAFAELQSLSLKDVSIETATKLLQRVQGLLQRISLKLYTDALSFAPVEELAAALLSCGTSLRKTRIILDDMSNERRRRPLSFSNTLLPAVCASAHVQDFVFQLNSPSAFDLRDIDLKKMARAWSDMRSFSVQWTLPDKIARHPGIPVAITRGGLFDEYALTLNGIVPFVEHCSVLEKLAFTSIHADVPFRHTDLLPQCQRPLCLEVGRAEIADSRVVTSFLHAIASDVKLSHSGIGRSWSLWEEVQEQLVGRQDVEKMQATRMATDTTVLPNLDHQQ